ncbi:hypothetical protein KAR91_70735 [Candidatus Pacearchaeota archaeon]|nr:hypothetical protein [Candidatus Pacearchaeota archaeon]
MKNIKCSECGKIGVFCTGLCQACYSKKQRNTPEGKLKTKLYNKTKGKEAVARYRAKKPPKPPKEIKICECGEIATVKGLCFRCYQKYYQRKRNGFSESKKIRDSDFNKIFESILSDVEKGVTITYACSRLGISSSFLYKTITERQKTELSAYKAIGKAHRKGDDEVIIHKFV